LFFSKDPLIRPKAIVLLKFQEKSDLSFDKNKKTPRNIGAFSNIF